MDVAEASELADRHVADRETDELLLEFLRAPSPHTAAMEADPTVKGFVAKVVAPQLEALSGTAPRLDGMGNLLWRYGGTHTSADGGLLLMGYAMTFPGGSMAEPFSPRIVAGEPYGLTGSCIRGRGACEQKGALAAMVAAVAAVKRSRGSLGKPLRLVVSLAGETGRHDAAAFILRHASRKPRWGIVGLGTRNRVCLGNKGRIDVELVVRGRSCHSSTPGAGIDAVAGARTVLERLDGVVGGNAHPHLGEATLVTTRIESGPDIPHTIQDYCRLVLDRRLLPGESPDEAFQQIAAALSGLDPLKVEASRGAFMFPSEVSSQSEIASALRRVSRRFLAAPGESYSQAALDAGYLNHQGIETVMFGPGDLRFAHTADEVVPLAEVRTAARIYAGAALQLLA